MSRRTALIATTALALGTAVAVLPTQAQAATVVVDTSAELSSAISGGTAGTVIQVRGGTYYPTATLQSTANGTSSSPVQLTAYGSETVKIDGSNLPDGDWIFKLTADYWNVSNITFQNSPDSAVVCQSCTGTVWNNIKTINGGDSGFTLTGDGTVNNTVRNIDSYGHYDAANHGENADGIAVKFGSGSGNLITGARLYNNSDDGLDFWSFSSPVTVEHTWAMGNGVNRWSDSAFAGDGNGYKLGGDGEVVAHVINNSAAWGNAATGSPRTPTRARSSSTGPPPTPTASGATTSPPAPPSSARTSPSATAAARSARARRSPRPATTGTPASRHRPSSPRTRRRPTTPATPAAPCRRRPSSPRDRRPSAPR